MKRTDEPHTCTGSESSTVPKKTVNFNPPCGVFTQFNKKKQGLFNSSEFHHSLKWVGSVTAFLNSKIKGKNDRNPENLVNPILHSLYRVISVGFNTNGGFEAVAEKNHSFFLKEFPYLNLDKYYLRIISGHIRVFVGSSFAIVTPFFIPTNKPFVNMSFKAKVVGEHDIAQNAGNIFFFV